MSPVPQESGKAFQVSVDPAEHARVVKEELVFWRMLGLCVLVRGRRGERGVIPEKVAIPEEVDTAEKPKTGLC